MYCKKCGNLIGANEVFCKNCGEPVNANINSVGLSDNVVQNQVSNNLVAETQNDLSMNNPNVNVLQNNSIPNSVPSEPVLGIQNDLSMNNSNVNVLQNSSIPNSIPSEPVSGTQNDLSMNNPNVDVLQNNSIPNSISSAPVANMNSQISNATSNMNDNIASQPLNQNSGLSQNIGTPMGQQNIYQQVQNLSQTSTPTQPVQTKKKKSSFMIIVIILVAVILILGAVILTKTLNKDDVDTPITNNGDSNKPVEEINNGNNSNNIFEYKNFQFPIPNNYQASLYEDCLQLVNQNDKILTLSYIYNGFTLEDFNDYALEEYKASLTDTGYIIKAVDNKKYNGVDWIVISTTITQNGQSMDVAVGISQLGSNSVVENVIMNYGTVSSDVVFKDLTNMYKNTTYNGSSQFSPNDEKDELRKFDMIGLIDSSLFN